MLTESGIRKIQGKLHRAGTNRWPLVFGALSDETRFCIFKILLGSRNLCVTDIARICKLTIAAASHQLKILEMVGLVIKVRRGRMICYEIKKNEPAVAAIVKVISH